MIDSDPFHRAWSVTSCNTQGAWRGQMWSLEVVPSMDLDGDRPSFTNGKPKGASRATKNTSHLSKMGMNQMKQMKQMNQMKHASPSIGATDRTTVSSHAMMCTSLRWEMGWHFTGLDISRVKQVWEKNQQTHKYLIIFVYIYIYIMYICIFFLFLLGGDSSFRLPEKSRVWEISFWGSQKLIVNTKESYP